MSDIHGPPNRDCPADVFLETPLACSLADADKTALSIDVTVVKADSAPLTSAVRSAATRAKDRKRGEFAERVADVNAALTIERRYASTPTFKFWAFGLDVYGAIGYEAQSILQLFAERRASRKILSVDLCSRSLNKTSAWLYILRMHV